MGKRDLITKDFALYVVHYFASMQTWSKEDILSEIDRKIKEAKEDVVRCKDCKHYHEYLHRTTKEPYGLGKCTHISMDIDLMGNDYCSYGERKEATP